MNVALPSDIGATPQPTARETNVIRDKKYSVLRWKIIGGTLAFSLIPLFAAGLFANHDFQTVYRARIINNLSTIVENKKRALDMFLEERAAQLRTLLYTQPTEKLSDEDSLRTLFQAMQASSRSFVDLGVIDQNGEHLAYVGPYQLENVNYSDQEWFQKTIFKGLYISDVFLGFRKFPHFIIAVARQEGDDIWILRATIDSDVFDSMVQAVQVGQSGDAFLVNQDNLLQTDSRFQGTVLDPSPVSAAPVFGGTDVTEAQVEGMDMLIGSCWLDSTPWRLVILEDPSEEMSALMRTKSLLAVVALGAVIIMSAGAVVMGNAIVGKVMQADQEKAAMDANLVQSSKMAALGKMAAGVAHEVNNPLSLIREGAGWLKDLLDDEDPETMRNHAEFTRGLEMIEQHVDRAREVTHRMLGFGRRMEPVQENVDLNGLVEQTMKFLHQEAVHRNIAVRADLQPDLPFITTDAAQLQQVILNVLDNGLDAVGQDGEITVSTRMDVEADQAVLTIKDNGPGIPKDVLQRLFDPFFTTKKVGEGTGLGLSICYSIVEKLGGRIEVVSEPGQGAEFTVRVPRRR